MLNAYSLLKLVHVVGAIVWVGGVLTMFLLNLRLSRQRDLAGLAVMARQGEFFGRAVAGPAAVLTFLAGIALVAMTGGHMALWTVWGLVGVFGSIAVGGIMIRRTALELAAVTTSAGDEARAMALRSRLKTLSMINVVLLLSTVVVMVLRPTL